MKQKNDGLQNIALTSFVEKSHKVKHQEEIKQTIKDIETVLGGLDNQINTMMKTS